MTVARRAHPLISPLVHLVGVDRQRSDECMRQSDCLVRNIWGGAMRSIENEERNLHSPINFTVDDAQLPRSTQQ